MRVTQTVQACHPEQGVTCPARWHFALTFVAILLALLFVFVLANLVPALRATRIDPMLALRHD